MTTRTDLEQLQLFDAALDAIIAIDASGKVTAWNRSAEETFGLTKAEAMGQPLADLVIPPQMRKAHSDGMKRFFRTGEGPLLNRRIEVSALHRDGHEFPIELTIIPLNHLGKQVFYAFVRDISARRQAEHASEAKTEFLAAMSHEIRTPLSGVIGYAELLVSSELNADQRRYVERIESAGSALLAVVNEILHFSRIEAGTIELEHRAFSLRALVDNTASIVRSVANKKMIPIRVEMDPALPEVLVGDEARLRQVLLNLLNNAIKFTPKGHVTLSIQCRGSSHSGENLCFAVTDTGIGIATDKHADLFDQFSQVHRANKNGGTGLGLAISKRLVELMGGTIGVKSKEGQGSTFWVEVTLPKAEATALHELNHMVLKATRSARILVADDLDMNQEIATAMLNVAGHKVRVVADGAEAVEAVQKGDYDLVLMDIQMPTMDGVAATKRIRELQPPACDVPIIAMTANVLPQQVRVFREVGMNDHIGKPFTREELLSKIDPYLLEHPSLDSDNSNTVIPATAFDEKAFRDLVELVGNDRTYARLAGFREHVTPLLSLDESRPINREETAGTAHRLASLAGSLGFAELSRRCKELENACLENRDMTETLRLVRMASERALQQLDHVEI